MKNTDYLEMVKFIEELKDIEDSTEKHHQKENIAESIYGLRDAKLLTEDEAEELISKM